MRYLSIYFAILTGFLLGCGTAKPSTEQPAAQTTPVVVGTDTVAMVTSVSVGKKSTVNVQVGGAGNVASAAKTDNTGRRASEGANGGNSQPTTDNKVPLWALALLALVAAGLGAWATARYQRWKARPPMT